MNETWNEIKGEYDKAAAEPERFRLCSQCLCAVERDKYDAHMQQQHGFETLTLE